jgi:hypothetical protein
MRIGSGLEISRSEVFMLLHVSQRAITRVELRNLPH